MSGSSFPYSDYDSSEPDSSHQGLIFVIDSNDRERVGEARDELMKMLSEDELRSVYKVYIRCTGLKFTSYSGTLEPIGSSVREVKREPGTLPRCIN